MEAYDPGSQLKSVTDAMSSDNPTTKSDPVAVCSHCQQAYPYTRIDNQISESWYAYCSSCGAVGVLMSTKALPAEVYAKCGYELATEAEPFLPACDCGGAFRRGALPRCPHCKAEISRDDVINMLDHFYSKREWSAATSGKGCLQHCVVINEHLQYL